MIANFLSSMWATIAPALGNHLWQSTLFAVVAGLLTLILRKNQARVRDQLWMAASLKFLIPFSLLVGIGSHFAWSRTSAGTNAGAYFAMEEVSQPFTQRAMPAITHATPPAIFHNLIDLLPAALAVAWLCGFIVVVSVWCARWLQIWAAAREATPLRAGREADALRRLESLAGMRKRTEMRVSRTSLGPGIFGIARPVLLLPVGISKRLDDAHLEAILAHELCHVRRRDNLAAAIHMVVEAIFWFHPLVWWLGARLIEERERACDEEVLQMGSERRVYAESILKTCEFCVGSPLDCVSGVTGADLKKRIAHIMTERISRKLDFSRRLLLGAVGFMAIAAPVVFGQVYAMHSATGLQAENAATEAAAYDVASIKLNDAGGIAQRVTFKYTPDGLVATNITLQLLIRDAYGVSDFQIIGAPNWLNATAYDIDAKMDDSGADKLQKLSVDAGRLERQHMLQMLLADRFSLKVHHETREGSLFALVVAKNGPKFSDSGTGNPNSAQIGNSGSTSGGPARPSIVVGDGKLIFHGLPIASLVGMLSQQLGRTVLDRTGLTGKYDFTLQWTPDEFQIPASDATANTQQGSDSALSPGSTAVSIFTTIQDQLGLKLESTKGPVDVLVIDHVEAPSEN